MSKVVQLTVLVLCLTHVDGSGEEDLCERTRHEIDGCVRNGYRPRHMKNCQQELSTSGPGVTSLKRIEQRRCLKVEKTAVNRCNIPCLSGNEINYL